MKFLSVLICIGFVFSAQASEKVFGKGDFKGEPAKLGDIVTKYDNYKGKKVVVNGNVSEVCAQEGCWMKLKEGGTEVRTIMKDHGFKVPKEIKDKTVAVEGFMEQKELPVKAVRHYMKDEGKSDEEINKVTQPQKVFQFVATAVKLQE